MVLERSRVHDDRGLVRYLMRHSHTTPFEMCELKLHVRVPMDVWRQWIRHRTANVNEYSTRYSVAISATQRTPPNEWLPAVRLRIDKEVWSVCRPNRVSICLRSK